MRGSPSANMVNARYTVSYHAIHLSSFSFLCISSSLGVEAELQWCLILISYPDFPRSYGREIWQSSILSMLSGSEARKTGLSITAHFRTFHCDFAERNIYFDSILEEILLGREQGNLKLKPKQKVALQAISLIGQNCLIVLPTGYEKSLTYQMLPSL